MLPPGNRFLGQAKKRRTIGGSVATVPQHADNRTLVNKAWSRWHHVPAIEEEQNDRAVEDMKAARDAATSMFAAQLLKEDIARLERLQALLAEMTTGRLFARRP